MQIDPTRLNPVGSAHIQRVGSTPAAPEAAATQGPEAATGTDQLALSQQATEVRAAHEALATVPEVRSELVAKLKAEIQAGTYKVDPEAIAEKLVP